MRKSLVSCFVAAACMFGMVATSSAETVKVWGSTTCQKRFLEPGAAELEKVTGVKVKVLGVAVRDSIQVPPTPTHLLQDLKDKRTLAFV